MSIRALALAVVLLPGWAIAQTGGQVSGSLVLNTFTTASGLKIYSGPNLDPLTGASRVWSPAAGGGVAVGDMAALGAKGGLLGAPLSVTLGRVITGANLLAAAQVYGAFVTGQGFGNAINDWLGQSRCVPLGDLLSNVLCDAGAPPTQTPGRVCDNVAGYQGLTCDEAGARIALQRNGYTSGAGYVLTLTSTTIVDALDTRYGFHATRFGSDWNDPAVMATFVASNVASCPAITDPYYVGWNQTANGQPGPDGKCRTGVYAPNPFADGAAKIAAQNPDGSSNAPAAAKAISDAGGKLDSDAVSSSGPASKLGTPSSSTQVNPDGSSQVTTTTPTYNYTYGPTSVTVSTSTSTVVNNYNAAGTLTGTTTTTTTPSAAPAESKTDCDKYPLDLACMPAGEPGSAEAIPNTNAPITYADVPFMTSGGCPAPLTISFSISGQSKSFVISYQPLCDLMTTLRPIFLALFAASAAFVFYDGIGRAAG